MSASKADEFEKDDGWKSVEEEHPYTDEELEEFEKQLQEEEKLKMAQQGAAAGVINTANKLAEVGVILKYNNNPHIRNCGLVTTSRLKYGK